MWEKLRNPDVDLMYIYLLMFLSQVCSNWSISLILQCPEASKFNASEGDLQESFEVAIQVYKDWWWSHFACKCMPTMYLCGIFQSLSLIITKLWLSGPWSHESFLGRLCIGKGHHSNIPLLFMWWSKRSWWFQLHAGEVSEAAYKEIMTSWGYFEFVEMLKMSFLS